MEDMEMICCQIIAQAGTAKSSFIEGMRAAREGDFTRAEKLLSEGNAAFAKAHDAHRQLLVKEANGEKIEFSLLLLHAEDQLNSADIFKTVAEENVEMLRVLLHK